MSLLEDRLVEQGHQTPPQADLSTFTIPAEGEDLETLELHWADETVPSPFDNSDTTTTPIVSELDSITTKWGTETIWLPPLADLRVELLPVASELNDLKKSSAVAPTWLPPLARMRIEQVPLKVGFEDEADSINGSSTTNKTSDDDDMLHENVRDTIARLRKELEDAKLAAERAAEAKKLSLIGEFSLNNAEYPGPILSARITDVARSMYEPEAPEEPDGTGFTRQELFDWLAGREAADAELQSSEAVVIVEDTIEAPSPFDETLAEDPEYPINALAEIILRQKTEHQARLLEARTVQEVTEVAENSQKDTHDDKQIERIGYPLQFEQFTTKHKYPFGKVVASRNEAYENNHGYKKRGRLWQKLAELAPKSKEKIAKFVAQATARTETVDHLLKNNLAHFEDSYSMSTPALIIDKTVGLAELAKTDHKAVKSLARGMRAFMKLSTGPQDIRHLAVQLSYDANEDLPKVTRKLLKHFPRLGAKLLRNISTK